MINPVKLADGKQYAIIQGYVIDVRDRGEANLLLFKKDTMDPASQLLSVAAWALAEGQSGYDLQAMTYDLKKLRSPDYVRCCLYALYRMP